MPDAAQKVIYLHAYLFVAIYSVCSKYVVSHLLSVPHTYIIKVTSITYHLMLHRYLFCLGHKKHM